MSAATNKPERRTYGRLQAVRASSRIERADGRRAANSLSPPMASKLAAMDRPSDSYRELKTLGTHVAHMVRRAMNAFASLDVDEAFKVVREDKEVDREYEAIQRQCITFMMEDPREIKRVMNVTWAARSLERIGDHAKNICEYVIYMAQGRDVRHTGISDSSDISSD